MVHATMDDVVVLVDDVTRTSYVERRSQNGLWCLNGVRMTLRYVQVLICSMSRLLNCEFSTCVPLDNLLATHERRTDRSSPS